jgi:hypothetical protein
MKPQAIGADLTKRCGEVGFGAHSTRTTLIEPVSVDGFTFNEVPVHLGSESGLAQKG